MAAIGNPRGPRFLVGFDPPKEGRGATHLEEIHGDHRQRERDEEHHREEVKWRGAEERAWLVARHGRREVHLALEPGKRHVARGFAFGQRDCVLVQAADHGQRALVTKVRVRRIRNTQAIE